MPLPPASREAQTRAWARQHFARNGEPSWLAQGLLWLALGVEIGYFDRDAAGTYLDHPGIAGVVSWVRGPRDDDPERFDPAVGRMPDRALRRVRELLANGFVPASDRPAIRESDPALLIYRAAIAPVSRIAAAGADVLDFLERATFDDEWAAPEAMMKESRLDETNPIPTLHAAIETFAYLRDVNEALSFKLPGEEHPALEGEVSLIYRVQLDLSNSRTRSRLDRAAESLVEATTTTSGELVLAARGQMDLILFGMAQGAVTYNARQWRAEMNETIQRFSNLTAR
jgi:hypothetical protein